MRRRAPLVISLLVLLLFGTLILRLGQIMLGQGEELAAEAAEQQTRCLDYYQYARGDILDRYGRPLVNAAENCLVIFPAMVEDAEAVVSVLSEVLELSEAKVQAHFSAHKSWAPYVFKTGLNAEQAEAVLEADLSGLSCLQLAARYGSMHPAVHLIGACRWEADAWQGISGLEAEYDAELRGRIDKQLLAYVDADGHFSLDALYLQEQEASFNQLELSLDLDYQQIVENAFRSLGYTGACVILDPQNGDILAASSMPGYDPYFFEEVQKDAYVNKAFSLYPPASTFKTLLAAAALNEGIPLPSGADSRRSEELGAALRTETATVEKEDPGAKREEADAEADAESSADADPFVCSGSYHFADGRTVSCTAVEGGHGPLDLEQALARSCNCYFVALGQALGGDLIREYCSRLGLCSQSLLGYPLEAHSPDAYLDFDDSVPADIANVSLGERGVMISPLQEAVLYASLVNGGYLCQPRLVKRLSDSEGRCLKSFPSGELQAVLKPSVAESLCAMLVEAVEGGTAASVSGAALTAGAKTGTSESGGVWISGFAPADAPQWVIVVHVDDGTAGGVEAAALFRRILEDIYQLEGE